MRQLLFLATHLEGFKHKSNALSVITNYIATNFLKRFLSFYKYVSLFVFILYEIVEHLFYFIFNFFCFSLSFFVLFRIQYSTEIMFISRLFHNNNEQKLIRHIQVNCAYIVETILIGNQTINSLKKLALKKYLIKHKVENAVQKKKFF